MKKLTVILAMLSIMGCSPKREVVQVINGLNGANGANGANGHSIVSQFNEVSGCECSNGGTRLDLYLDLDDSLSASEEDLYQGSLVACNGLNGLSGADGQNGLDGEDGLDGIDGLNGEQGPQGIAGEQGPQGQIGPQGLAGANGLQGPVGPQGSQGPQGTQGLQGLQGATGATGAPGSAATITVYASTSSCVSIVGSAYYTKNGDIYDNNSCSSSHKVAVLQGSGDSFWVATKMLATDNNGSGLRVITFN